MAQKAPNWLYKAAREGSTAAEESLSFWRKYAPILARDGRLTDLDYPAFLRTAVSYGQMMEAARILATEGITAPVPKGQDRGSEKRHPAALVYQNAGNDFWTGCAQFGLTPLARGKMRAPDVPDTENDGLLD